MRRSRCCRRKGLPCAAPSAAAAAPASEWCERRLLARIHRYTVKRLRAEIEPIEARDFLRFLFDWQRVVPALRMEGPDAVGAILGQLEGYEAPASAWETEILPQRISEYEPAWLDEQCLAGRFVWTRLAPRRADPERGAAPVRTTPIVLLARRNVRLWSSLTSTTGSGEPLRRRTACGRVPGHPRRLFLRRDQRRHRAAALAGGGSARRTGGARAHQLRQLRRPARAVGARGPAQAGDGRPAPAAHRAVRHGCGGPLVAHRAHGAGGARPSARCAEETIEHVVRTLLRRWGVVFWRLLAREAQWLPPWRDLLMCCRRLEARGEIRGGRFVAGFSGEQYAAPEAIALLREARRKPLEGHHVAVSGADPLNLVGILTPGARLPSLIGNRVLYRDGVPVATLAGGEVSFLTELPPAQQWEARNLLLRRNVPAALADLA